MFGGRILSRDENGSEFFIYAINIDRHTNLPLDLRRPGVVSKPICILVMNLLLSERLLAFRRGHVCNSDAVEVRPKHIYFSLI